MIEVRNIAFSYRSRQVLRDVSFVVSSGESVSIVGANGTGKATLMKILATLFIPDSGSIVVDGQNALEKPLKFRRQLGYLPERIALYDDMTVKEYLSYRALLKGEMKKRIRRRIDEACEISRTTHLMRTPIYRLSAGLKKRVALADALLLRPHVLLLDDFLSGLDIEMKESMGEIMTDAAAFSAVIATGHDIDDLAKWTTRFLVLSEGVIQTSVQAVGMAPNAIREKLKDALKKDQKEVGR